MALQHSLCRPRSATPLLVVISLYIISLSFAPVYVQRESFDVIGKLTFGRDFVVFCTMSDNIQQASRACESLSTASQHFQDCIHLLLIASSLMLVHGQVIAGTWDCAAL